MRATNLVSGAVIAGVLGAAGLAWSMDVGDVKQEWTVEGRKLAAERIKLPKSQRIESDNERLVLAFAEVDIKAKELQ